MEESDKSVQRSNAQSQLEVVTPCACQQGRKVPDEVVFIRTLACYVAPWPGTTLPNAFLQARQGKDSFLIPGSGPSKKSAIPRHGMHGHGSLCHACDRTAWVESRESLRVAFPPKRGLRLNAYSQTLTGSGTAGTELVRSCKATSLSKVQLGLGT